jgi:hypothetical protein
MEYQFPRLSADREYLPLIMALKGFQLAGNPHPVNPFMDGGKYRHGPSASHGIEALGRIAPGLTE